jgi:hypothetical protein
MGKKARNPLGKCKSNTKDTNKDVKDDDDALLREAIELANTELKKIENAETQKRNGQEHEQGKKDRDDERGRSVVDDDDDEDVRPEDTPVFSELPGAFELPAAVRAEPNLVQALQSVDPAATSKTPSATPVDYSKETPRERELRLREVRNKLKTRHQVDLVKRGGKHAVQRAAFREPTVIVGDERADEIAVRPNLIQAYVRRFADWLMEGARATGLLDTPDTPQHFALFFRFDLSKDPVARCARSLLGSQLEVLLVGFQKVVYFLASDYADGLFAAVKNGALDPLLTSTCVLAVLPGGTQPSVAHGERMTGLDQLAIMPHLSSHAYPHGIPSELVHSKRTWGSDLGTESSAEKLARTMASRQSRRLGGSDCDSDSDDEALDDLDDEADERVKQNAHYDDPIARTVHAELRALGRLRYPLTKAILDAFA